MRLRLQDEIMLQQGIFTTVVAAEDVIITMINSNPDLQRYLFLFVGGNYSRILTGVHRTTTHFDVQRAFTAHQLFTILTGASHTVIFVEHDLSLYEGAWDMITPIGEALSECSHDALVILYSPTPDRAFCALARKATRLYFLSPVKVMGSPTLPIQRHGSSQQYQVQFQKTLDAWSGA